MLCHKCNVWYDGGDPKYCPRCAEEIESDAEQKIDTILAKPGTYPESTMPTTAPVAEDKSDLSDTSESAVQEEQEEYLWLVRSSNGAIERFESEQDVKKAILDGKIQPGMQAKKISDKSNNAESDEEGWGRVDRTLAKSAFDVRVLFQPIWAHTIRGAGVGVILGIVLWLGSWVYTMVSDLETFLSAGVVALFLITWAALLFPEPVRSHISGNGRKFVLVGMAIFAYTFFSKTGQFGPIFSELFLGFQVQFGATIGGAAAGVCPGMILGTLVGLVRKSRLTLSPHAAPEGFAPFIKCILLPSLSFAALTYLYIEFIGPWAMDLLSE